MFFCGSRDLIEKPKDKDSFFTLTGQEFKIEKFCLSNPDVWYKVEFKYTGDVYLPGDKKLYSDKGLNYVYNLNPLDKVRKSFLIPDMFSSDIKQHKWYAYQLAALVDDSFWLPYPPLARDLEDTIGETLQPVSKDVYATKKEISVEGLPTKLLTSDVETALEVIRIFWDVRGEIIPSDKLRIQLYHDDEKVLKALQFLLLKISVLSKYKNNKLWITDWESKKLFLRFIPTYKTIENFHRITPGEGLERKDLFFFDEIHSIKSYKTLPSYKNQSQFLIDNTILQ